MGVVISLILIAFGAILTWAVNADGGSVDPQVVGVILMIVGLGRLHDLARPLAHLVGRRLLGALVRRPGGSRGQAAGLPTGQAAKHHLRGGGRTAATTTACSVGGSQSKGVSRG